MTTGTGRTMEKSLIDLEAMTDKLPRLSELIANKIPDFAEYKTDSGVSFGINLKNTESVSVADRIFSAGTTFKCHFHSQTEVCIVYDGEIVCFMGDKEVLLNIGDSIVIPPGQPHSWEAKKDTRAIFVAVPHSKGYPDGKN